jgi:hypothetical protein
MTSPDTAFHLSPAVCTALDLSPGTLNNWAARGLLASFSTPSEGRGRKRSYSTTEFLALALIRTASEFGVTASPEFYSFAPEAARAWFEHPEAVKQVVFRHYMPGHRTVIAYNDEVMKEPPEPGAVLSFTFELREIFASALSALAKVEAERELKQASTVVAEPGNPVLTAIRQSNRSR